MDYKQELENIKQKVTQYKDQTLKLTTEKQSNQQELLDYVNMQIDIDKYIRQYQSIPFPSVEEKKELESWLQQKADCLEIINSFANYFENVNKELDNITSDTLEKQATLIKNMDQFKEISDKVKMIEKASKKMKAKETDPKNIVPVVDFQGRTKQIHITLADDYKKLSELKKSLLVINNKSYNELILQITDDNKETEPVNEIDIITEDNIKSAVAIDYKTLSDIEKISELKKRIANIMDPKNHKGKGKKVRFKYYGQIIEIPVVLKGRLSTYSRELYKLEQGEKKKQEYADQLKEVLNKKPTKFTVNDPYEQDPIVNGFVVKDNNNNGNQEYSQESIDFINSLTQQPINQSEASQNLVNQYNENDSKVTNPLAQNLINQYNENSDYLLGLELQQDIHKKEPENEFKERDIYSTTNHEDRSSTVVGEVVEEPKINPVREPVNSVRKLRRRDKIKDFIKRSAAAIVASIMIITAGSSLISMVKNKISSAIKDNRPVITEVIDDDKNTPDIIEEVTNEIQIGNKVQVGQGSSIYKSASDSILDEHKYRPYFGYDSERLILGTIVEFEDKQYNINATDQNANTKLNQMLDQGAKVVSVLTANKEDKDMKWDGKAPLSNEEYSNLAEGWFNPDNLNVKERGNVR